MVGFEGLMVGWNDKEVEDSALTVRLELEEILRRDLSMLEVALGRSKVSEGRVEREGGIARGGSARLRPRADELREAGVGEGS